MVVCSKFSPPFYEATRIKWPEIKKMFFTHSGNFGRMHGEVIKAKVWTLRTYRRRDSFLPKLEKL